MQLSRLARCAFVSLLLCIGARAAAAGDIDFTAEHSANARAALSDHHKQVNDLIASYHERRAMVAGRFEKSAERYVRRYASQMDRMVRDLTRKGTFDAATGVQAMLSRVNALEIAPPDDQGRHFLSKESLEVEPSEAASKLGLDLQIQIEQLRADYDKQVEANFKLYANEVLASREVCLTALERVIAREQQAGRLAAVQEVQALMQLLKDGPAVSRPAAPVVVEKQPEVNEASPDQDAALPAYYALTYSREGSHYYTYVLSLTKHGGKRLSSRYAAAQSWNYTQAPVEWVERKDDYWVMRVNRGLESYTYHAVKLVRGSPAQSKAWYSKRSFEEGMTALDGRVYRLGSPGADLLGLEDGLYELDMDMRINRSNKFEAGVFRLKIEIAEGVVAKTHYSWKAGANSWKQRGPFPYSVQTRGKTLTLRYDRHLVDWPDVFEIDMSGVGGPTVKYWWQEKWKIQGDEPSLTGRLIKLD